MPTDELVGKRDHPHHVGADQGNVMEITGQVDFFGMEKKPRMNVLIACEESQEVCKAFRAKGHRAFSCDLQECSGGHPEWHIQGDCLALINGNCTFKTDDTHTGGAMGFVNSTSTMHLPDGNRQFLVQH